MNSRSKIRVFMSAAMLITGSAHAMQFEPFDQLDITDQAEFVATMIAATQIALTGEGQADQAAQIEQLFTTVNAGDSMSVGLVELERNVARLREFDAQAVEKDANAKRFDVEDALFATLEKNKIPMTEDIMSAVFTAMANFHSQTYAQFEAQSSADQQRFVALLIKLAWPDYEFRDNIQARLSNRDPTGPDAKRDRALLIGTEFPQQSSNQPAYDEFAQQIATEYQKSPKHKLFNNLVLFILEKADAQVVQKIAGMDANAVMLPDGRHVFPDIHGQFWYYPKDSPRSGCNTRRSGQSRWRSACSNARTDAGISNGADALAACRDEVGHRECGRGRHGPCPGAPPIRSRKR